MASGVRAVYAASDDAGLLDPAGNAWNGVGTQPLDLMGTPLGLQPTAAIRTSWSDRRIGAIGRVDVAVAHNGATLAFRLEWNDPSEDRQTGDTTAFADAAAVMHPGSPEAPLMTMGKPGAPVNAWYWRADEDGSGRHIVAEGFGTTRTLDTTLVRTRSTWSGGRWRVVIARSLRAPEEAGAAQLAPGQETRFGIAVWQGSAGERAGIKAFSGDWIPLHLTALPAAGS